MFHLFLTRHGETVWNTQSRMQGRQDSPLTEIGLRQANRLAEELRDIPLDLIWSSPAPRARKTAEIIMAAQPDPAALRIDERIQEMSLGDWEGLSIGEAESADPANLHAFLYEPHLFQPVGPGESFQQVSDRLADFLADLTDAARICGQPERDCYGLVISHNITLKALFALMEQRPLAMLRDGPPLGQAELFRARLNGRWHIVAVRDLCLSGEK